MSNIRFIDEEGYPCYSSVYKVNNVDDKDKYDKEKYDKDKIEYRRYHAYCDLMSKFERARIIGMEAERISIGGPPYVMTNGITDAIKIAKKELNEQCIPINIIRQFPNGLIEIREVSTLINRTFGELSSF